MSTSDAKRESSGGCLGCLFFILLAVMALTLLAWFGALLQLLFYGGVDPGAAVGQSAEQLQGNRDYTARMAWVLPLVLLVEGAAALVVLYFPEWFNRKGKQ